MQITLTDTNGTYSISTVEDFVSLEEIIALLVKPILLAASFSEAQLDDYFINKEKDDFEIIFEGWDDKEEEVAANAAPQQPPMEKAVCKKVVAKAPVTVVPKVVAKVPVEKKVVAVAPKAVAKVATARMAV